MIPGMSFELLIIKKFLCPAKAEEQYRRIVIVFAVGEGRVNMGLFHSTVWSFEVHREGLI